METASTDFQQQRKSSNYKLLIERFREAPPLPPDERQRMSSRVSSTEAWWKQLLEEPNGSTRDAPEGIKAVEPPTPMFASSSARHITDHQHQATDFGHKAPVAAEARPVRRWEAVAAPLIPSAAAENASLIGKIPQATAPLRNEPPKPPSLMPVEHFSTLPLTATATGSGYLRSDVATRSVSNINSWSIPMPYRPPREVTARNIADDLDYALTTFKRLYGVDTTREKPADVNAPAATISSATRVESTPDKSQPAELSSLPSDTPIPLAADSKELAQSSAEVAKSSSPAQKETSESNLSASDGTVTSETSQPATLPSAEAIPIEETRTSSGNEQDRATPGQSPSETLAKLPDEAQPTQNTASEASPVEQKTTSEASSVEQNTATDASSGEGTAEETRKSEEAALETAPTIPEPSSAVSETSDVNTAASDDKDLAVAQENNSSSGEAAAVVEAKLPEALQPLSFRDIVSHIEKDVDAYMGTYASSVKQYLTDPDILEMLAKHATAVVTTADQTPQESTELSAPEAAIARVIDELKALERAERENGKVDDAIDSYLMRRSAPAILSDLRQLREADKHHHAAATELQKQSLNFNTVPPESTNVADASAEKAITPAMPPPSLPPATSDRAPRLDLTASTMNAPAKLTDYYSTFKGKKAIEDSKLQQTAGKPRPSAIATPSTTMAGMQQHTDSEGNGEVKTARSGYSTDSLHPEFQRPIPSTSAQNSDNTTQQQHGGFSTFIPLSQVFPSEFPEIRYAAPSMNYQTSKHMRDASFSAPSDAMPPFSNIVTALPTAKPRRFVSTTQHLHDVVLEPAEPTVDIYPMNAHKTLPEGYPPLLPYHGGYHMHPSPHPQQQSHHQQQQQQYHHDTAQESTWYGKRKSFSDILREHASISQQLGISPLQASLSHHVPPTTSDGDDEVTLTAQFTKRNVAAAALSTQARARETLKKASVVLQQQQQHHADESVSVSASARGPSPVSDDDMGYFVDLSGGRAVL